MPPTVPDWPHLVVLMAVGNGPDPSLRGVVQVTETVPAEDDEPADLEIDGMRYGLRSDRIRVATRGRLARREHMDGRPLGIRGRDTVWTWENGLDLPVARPASTGHFHWPDSALTSRRELTGWSGDDFTRPLGPAVATTFLGRDAWRVEIAPPPHKPYPLTMVIDAVTGLVLSQSNAGWHSVTEWVELELDVDLPDTLFEWTGETRPEPDRAAEHERDLAARREWLSGHGVGEVALTVPVELLPHEWSDDGSFHASVNATLNGSLLRRPHSDEPWADDVRWPFRHQWTQGGWDWLFGTSEDLSGNQLAELKRQLGG